MGKLRYREANNSPKVPQPASGRAGIQTNASLHTTAGVLEGAWHFVGRFPDSVLLLLKRPVKDATVFALELPTFYKERQVWPEASESTEALRSAGPRAPRGKGSRRRAS